MYAPLLTHYNSYFLLPSHLFLVYFATFILKLKCEHSMQYISGSRLLEKKRIVAMNSSQCMRSSTKLIECYHICGTIFKGCTFHGFGSHCTNDCCRLFYYPVVKDFKAFCSENFDIQISIMVVGTLFFPR